MSHFTGMIRLASLFFWMLIVFLSGTALASDRPNIIMILVDDMGYSDLGCYGSEIATPNIDKLADQGIRFRQFYNSGKCEPTRASLMSGLYWQTAGFGVQRGITLGQAMCSAGYAAYAVGKWHLDGNPVDRGFEHYFGHLSGAAQFFQPNSTTHLDRALYTSSEAPKDFYTTDANTDFALRFIEEGRKKNPDKPFFVYLAYNAPHSPLQAWPQDIAKYQDRYLTGWDRLRQQRFERQQKIGLIEPSWKLPPRPDTIPAWNSLTPQQQRLEADRMAVYAAMIDRIDQNVGRLINQLNEWKIADNTCIIFLSDNGANPFDRQRSGTVGMPNSHWETGIGWSYASNTPFRYYKRNQHQGGIATPCILWWPKGVAKPGQITDQAAHIIDLMPTLLDLGGGQYPVQTAGKDNPPLPGVSLRPLMEGRPWKGHDELYFHLFDHRALMQGDWKLVSDFGRPWELYNITQDRTELNNLAASQSARVSQMQTLWDNWAKSQGGIQLRSAGEEPSYVRIAPALDADNSQQSPSEPAKTKVKRKSKQSAILKEDEE